MELELRHHSKFICIWRYILKKVNEELKFFSDKSQFPDLVHTRHVHPKTWLTCGHGVAYLWLRSANRNLPSFPLWARWMCLVQFCYLGGFRDCNLANVFNQTWLVSWTSNRLQTKTRASPIPKPHHLPNRFCIVCSFLFREIIPSSPLNSWPSFLCV